MKLESEPFRPSETQAERKGLLATSKEIYQQSSAAFLLQLENVNECW